MVASVSAITRSSSTTRTRGLDGWPLLLVTTDTPETYKLSLRIIRRLHGQTTDKGLQRKNHAARRRDVRRRLLEAERRFFLPFKIFSWRSISSSEYMVLRQSAAPQWQGHGSPGSAS